MVGTMRILGIGLALTFLSACSNLAWYEGFKVRAANECNQQPPGAREDCLKQLNQQPYDAYEKERAARP